MVNGILVFDTLFYVRLFLTCEVTSLKRIRCGDYILKLLCKMKMILKVTLKQVSEVEVRRKDEAESALEYQ